MLMNASTSSAFPRMMDLYKTIGEQPSGQSYLLKTTVNGVMTLYVLTLRPHPRNS